MPTPALQHLDLITLDYETYYDPPRYGLGTMNVIEYVRDPRFYAQGVGITINDGERVWHSADDVEEALDEIHWPTAILLAQNTRFDGFILTQIYGHKPAYYADTKSMGSAFWPGQPASLKDMCVRAWPDDENMRKGDELALTKGIRELTAEQDAILGGYCKDDVRLTRDLFYFLLPHTPQKELDIIDLTIRMFCEPKMVADVPMLEKVRDDEIAATEKAIDQCGADRATLASNPMFFDFMVELGLDPPTKINAKGKTTPALSQSDLSYIDFQANNPTHKGLFFARKSVKSRLKETRAQRLIQAVGPDGTIPGPLNYYAAHTGRFGGAEALNMQNLPRGSDLRLALCAPQGQLIFVTDLSAIEARITAWLAGEDTLIAQFANGVCVYSDFAGKIYHKPINKKDHPVERHLGKVCQLGLGFGMGAANFSNTLESGSIGPVIIMPFHRIQGIVHLWRRTYPAIVNLWTKLEIKLANTLNKTYSETWRCLTFENSSIILPNGMALKYNNLRYEDGRLVYDGKRGTVGLWGGSILENIAQALARIILTDAMLAVDKDQSIPGNLVLQVHDEFLFLGEESDPDVTMSKLNSHMCAPKDWAEGLPLQAEGGYDVRYSK